MELSTSSENQGADVFISTQPNSKKRAKVMFESNDLSFRTSRSTRKNVATNYQDIEFAEPQTARRRTVGPKVQYVESVKKQTKSKTRRSVKLQMSWTKVGWMICAALTLRLIFMEGGFIDFYKMDGVVLEKTQHLEELKTENKDLALEIKKIRTSPAYQKKITRDHLGVIAKDEYLILFSKN